MVSFLKSFSTSSYSSRRKVVDDFVEQIKEEDKMIRSSSSSSSDIVSDDHDDRISDDQKCKSSSLTLTVWRKSLVLSCNGFTVIDSNGDLVYRVDNYICKPAHIVLMNGSGDSILTMRRHKMRMNLVDIWQVYEGEEDKNGKRFGPKKQRPIWYVKRHISLLQTNNKKIAHVFVGSSSTSGPNTTRPAYVIQGSYGQRCCKVLDNSKMNVVAEIKHKEAINNSASFGHDVFHLVVRPGFDAGLAMALVLMLDQMFG